MRRAFIVVLVSVAVLWLAYSKINSAFQARQRTQAVADAPTEPEAPAVFVSAFAKSLSPTKPADEQNRQERVLLQVMRSRAGEIESAFRLQLFDDDGNLKTPMESLEKLNAAIMRQRGAVFGNDHLLPKMVIFGADAGLALYRIHKVNTQQPIIDCAGRKAVLEEYDRLRPAVCKGWERQKCDGLFGYIDHYMRNEYRHIAQWLPNFPIDDYGFMCSPYRTLETWAKRVIAKFPSPEVQRRVFIGNTDVDMGLALYRLAQHIQANAPPAPVAQKPSKPLHQKQRLRALRAVEGDLL